MIFYINNFSRLYTDFKSWNIFSKTTPILRFYNIDRIAARDEKLRSRRSQRSPHPARPFKKHFHVNFVRDIGLVKFHIKKHTLKSGQIIN
jgi:hypothetical protein